MILTTSHDPNPAHTEAANRTRRMEEPPPITDSITPSELHLLGRLDAGGNPSFFVRDGLLSAAEGRAAAAQARGRGCCVGGGGSIDGALAWLSELQFINIR